MCQFRWTGLDRLTVLRQTAQQWTWNDGRQSDDADDDCVNLGRSKRIQPLPTPSSDQPYGMLLGDGRVAPDQQEDTTFEGLLEELLSKDFPDWPDLGNDANDAAEGLVEKHGEDDLMDSDMGNGDTDSERAMDVVFLLQTNVSPAPL